MSLSEIERARKYAWVRITKQSITPPTVPNWSQSEAYICHQHYVCFEYNVLDKPPFSPMPNKVIC